jgi:hypothetical protein
MNRQSELMLKCLLGLMKPKTEFALNIIKKPSKISKKWVWPQKNWRYGDGWVGIPGMVPLKSDVWLRTLFCI